MLGRSLVAVVSVVVAMAFAASPAMGIQILNSPLGGIVLTVAQPAPTIQQVVTTLCPAQPAPPGGSANACTVGPIGSIAASCATSSLFANSNSACIVATPAVVAACGGSQEFFTSIGGGEQKTFCGLNPDTTPIGLSCDVIGTKFGSTYSCALVAGTPVISDVETTSGGPVGTDHHAETLTIAGVRYACLDDVCKIETS